MAGLAVAQHEVDAAAGEGIIEAGLGEAALQRDFHWLVVLVAVVVEHDDNLLEPGEHEVRLACHQVGVLHGDIGWQQGLGHVAAVIHGIQAEVPAEVGNEINTAFHQFRRLEQPRRKH